MAEYTSSYKAKGVLTNSDLLLTETKKEAILVHDLGEALKKFEGQEVVILISSKQEVEPKPDDDTEDGE